MSKLLYIQASPRGKRSRSITVADSFVEAYKQKNPDDTIETLNIFSAELPNFDGLAVQAKYTIIHGQQHTPEELQAWEIVEKTIKAFKSADKYVLAIPMWNFGIPYRLKHYIDIIVQPGYTFAFSEETGYTGLVTGKPLLTVYARGGQYENDPNTQPLDLQKKYVELVFGFMGFENINSIIVEPTILAGPDVASEKVDLAIKQAKDFAEKL